uniref:Vacuolar protein sorting-associated protein 1 n=1 Tax=Ganoderma boninense TaxID=34458 RepID=A0A5K1K269_9APHY|nr:Vacuolar protein sorting-associated protein 1 [Ganoderma boninense]
MSQASPLLLDLFPRIDNTFGAILIATFLGIAVFETLHIVLSTHICYYYLVTSFGHPEALLTLVWSLSFILFTAELGGDPLQVSFPRAQSRRLSTSPFMSSGTIRRIRVRPQWLVSAGAGMCLLADAFITAILVNLLRSKHIGVKRYGNGCRSPSSLLCVSLPVLIDIFAAPRTDRLLKTLILYTINTGLLTGMMDLFTFLFVRTLLRLRLGKRSFTEADLEHGRVRYLYLQALVSPNNFIYIAFGILTTKMYANSLLAALNTRNSLRYGPHEAVTITVPSPSPAAAVLVVPGRRQETSTFESESQKQATIELPKAPLSVTFW